MTYLVEIKSDHVYVKYSDEVTALDVIALFSDQLFITSFRTLQAVIHDFSGAKNVNMAFADIRELAVLSNIESNFTEKLTAIIIPFDPTSSERVTALCDAIRAKDWHIQIATSYPEALALI
ncbi:hypothetical protein [Aliiglaciecola litoralis]|uniref:DUF4180 domain-containing protein n=1 Tax=Aliiglaciecola litoralis TaxID=582857 RepID=A0ABN1LCW6_9ALTE